MRSRNSSPGNNNSSSSITRNGNGRIRCCSTTAVRNFTTRSNMSSGFYSTGNNNSSCSNTGNGNGNGIGNGNGNGNRRISCCSIVPPPGTSPPVVSQGRRTGEPIAEAVDVTQLMNFRTVEGSDQIMFCAQFHF
jgi:hypothetical protein